MDSKLLFHGQARTRILLGTCLKMHLQCIHVQTGVGWDIVATILLVFEF